tara:strand:+ start:7745 stop:8467 length:723 start_codon:yes stop_codon:yes gene_type:complete
MKYKLTGDNLQIASIELGKADTINAQAGSLIYKTGNVVIEVESKGVGKIFKRMITGESLFLTKYKTVDGSGIVGVAGNIPGKIKSFDLKQGESIIAEKGAYLCSDQTIDIDIKFVKKIGAALFGGEGIILQKINGPGTVLVHAAGDLIEYNLKKGERMDVDTSHIVAFEESVDYDIRRVGGVKSTVFGGEGLFLAQMTGPGKVVLQSMTKLLFQPPTQHSNKGSARGSVLGGMIGGAMNR